MFLIQVENNLASYRKTASKAKRRKYEKKCQSCGACCSFYAYRPKQIHVKDGDLMGDRRFSFEGIAIFKWVWESGVSTVTRLAGWFLRRKKEDGWWKCIALEGNVGQSVRCAVYDRRPSTCRDFDPGSNACINIRKWAGLEAA